MNADQTICCGSWFEAYETGTDNEGYGPLAYAKPSGEFIGDALPPVKYCPWCGAAKNTETQEAIRGLTAALNSANKSITDLSNALADAESQQPYEPEA